MTIKWRLAALMAERGYSNKKLAELMSFHEVTVSKLRKQMPDRLEKDTLEKLCAALECQPGDLMRWQQRSAQDTTADDQPIFDIKTPISKSSTQQSKNTRALRAKATATRTQVWEELRKPLLFTDNTDDSSIA